MEIGLSKYAAAPAHAVLTQNSLLEIAPLAKGEKTTPSARALRRAVRRGSNSVSPIT
jgi:hypothetical protein